MFEAFDSVKDQYEKWHDAAFMRRSCRGYRDVDLSKEERQKIINSREILNTLMKNVRIATVFGKEESHQAFSMVGGYGTIKKPQAFAAFIADENTDWAYEKAGFLGEAFILDMTSMGFDTCWVSGTYNKAHIAKIIDLKPGEKVLAATPVGFAADKKGPMERFTVAYSGGSYRKPVDKICLQFELFPEWAKECVTCAQKAPSAANNQPWFFEFSDDTLFLRKPPQNGIIPYTLDLGICMLHVAITAALCGEKRIWEKTALKYHAAFKRGHQ